MFNYYAASVLAGPANGVVDGVFIPVADLAGLTQAELSETGATREGKVIYGLLNSIYAGLAEIASLGLVNLTKSDPSGTGVNRFTESISLSVQWLLDLSSRSFSSIPLPITGSESGKGKVALEDIWPDAEIVTAEGSISGPGVLLADSLLTTYGASELTATTDDARDWIGALFAVIIANATVRTSTVASAITTRTNPLTIRGTGVTIPASWFDATNPVTGILAADVLHLRVFQETYSVEYELQTNPETQTVEIRVATL
jgi:hypothetical protein